ncbi:hypothetical protein [Arthrobacter sp. CJ23]|uniref:hypothetical protein n=1 Tax=Arthrobacter sp. CJ23 TaxID=2972479 RepID=UPI00215CE7F1|nr:hypothetical protein [Arthrobacter sp. CJ23]UVJ38111.1 hypothetical protein NVV90_12665 [Arthrobacter sp. CJ23]
MMITRIESGEVLHVTGNSTSHIEDELSTAVVLVRQRAQEVQQGILVTRLGPASYTVALDEGIPYGVTDERDEWTSRGLRGDSGDVTDEFLT